MERMGRFKRGDSQKLFKSLAVEDQQKILDFIKYVSITSKSEKRLANNKRSLLTFIRETKSTLDNIDLNILRDFLATLNKSDLEEASKNELKHTLKRFLKWNFEDWSKRFNNLEDIKCIMRINEQKINASTLLKKEDIEKIMKEEPKLFWKTFFISLYETGLRPIELRNLSFKDIKFDVEKGGISEINIYATKTSRARSVFVKEATFYLKKLKERNENDLVFPSPRDKTKSVNKDVCAIWLGKISERVLGRRVYPYILRHSRATELYINAKIPDKIAQKFLGHSKDMSDVYTHMSNKDVKLAMTNTIYNLEELPKEKRDELTLKIEAQAKQLQEQEKKMSEFGAMNENLLSVVIKALSVKKSVGINLEELENLQKTYSQNLAKIPNTNIHNS